MHFTTLTILILKAFVVLTINSELSLAIQKVNHRLINNELKLRYTGNLGKDLDDDNPLEVTFDTSEISSRKSSEPTDYEVENLQNGVRYKWGSHTSFTSKPLDKNENACQQLEYTTALKVPLKVTFNISGVHLFGGSERSVQLWPVEKQTFTDYPYVSKELDSQAVLEPYWLNSRGTYVYVNKEVPLFISLNNVEKTFSIIAGYKHPYIRKDETFTMKFALCTLPNARLAHEHAVANFLGKPSALPDTRMVTDPIWSTWAKYKMNVNELAITQFVNDISANGFEEFGGQIEIDDKWETCYGSLTVDPVRFPNMKRLVGQIKKQGYRVSFWTHPFINLDCPEVHSEAERFGYLVKNTEHNSTSIWWNGVGSYIDFTNSDAASWYKNRLKRLQRETDVDAYKFDAGETSWSPQVPVFDRMEPDHPETILKYYVKTAAEFGGLTEVRSARGTQSYPIYLRMMDRESNWSFDRGVASLVTTAILFNMLGYPFVMPDMIGGNRYKDELIDDDIFVRWLQACIFMPSIQFSILPWEVSQNTLNLTKKFLHLHQKYSNKIIDAMKKSVENGSPVNPPIWWIDPTNPEALACDSEYLLGEDILVAPVLTANTTSRDIYLPAGKWRDEANPDHPIIEGSRWLRNYRAELDTLPYFTRVQSAASAVSSALNCILLLLSCIVIIILH